MVVLEPRVRAFPSCMLFLTYHRVLPAGTIWPADFYTVGADALESHLDLLAARGFSPADAADFLAGSGGELAYFLTFDDGTVDHAEVVAPLLEARGLRGIFFVPTAKLNRPGYLTDAQATALARAGHVLGCHSHEHRRMDTQTEAEIREQLRVSMNRLTELAGAAPQFFAPPGGYSAARVRRIAGEFGLRAIRTMQWGLNRPLRLDALECIPINRRVTSDRLVKILDGRGLGWLKCLFLGKQMLKSVLPMRAYERTRAALFRPGSEP